MAPRKYKPPLPLDPKLAMQRLAKEMADGSIVTQALGRYIYQIIEYCHEYISETQVEPLKKRIKELEDELQRHQRKPNTAGGHCEVPNECPPEQSA